MRFRAHLPFRAAAFPVLMALAAVLSLLPHAWTDWMRAPFQILALPQWPAAAGVQKTKTLLAQAHPPRVSAAACQRLQAENEELRRLLGQQGAWLADLERRVDEVCGIRGQLWSSDVRLLITPVWGCLLYTSPSPRDS